MIIKWLGKPVTGLETGEIRRVRIYTGFKILLELRDGSGDLGWFDLKDVEPADTDAKVLLTRLKRIAHYRRKMCDVCNGTSKIAGRKCPVCFAGEVVDPEQFKVANEHPLSG